MNAISCSIQFFELDVETPRFREAGDVTLDKFHRDGRVEDRWLGLHPREFAMLWQLAEWPGHPMSCEQLMPAIWCIQGIPDRNAVTALAARVRDKLVTFGLASLMQDHPAGCFLLDVAPAPGSMQLSRPAY